MTVAAPARAGVLQQAVDRGLRWVKESGIRRADGAYMSRYSPSARQYVNWYAVDGNRTCLNSTTGAVMVLDQSGDHDLALQSADHLLTLAIPSGELRGALLSGEGAKRVFTNWNASAIVALAMAHARSADDKYLRAAVAAGDFLLRMQERDGSIIQDVPLERGRAWRERWLKPRQLWLANSIEAFGVLAQRTGDARYSNAARRFVEWMAPQQLRDGAFPMYAHTLSSRLAVAVRQRNLTELARGCTQRHPTTGPRAIHALLAYGHVDAARRCAARLVDDLSRNGLFFERYDLSGGHFVAEDVMPTAQYAQVALQHPELGVPPDVLARVAAGIVYAQITSDDPNADGGIRGVPLHPQFGGEAYCWDTVHAIRYLRCYIAAGAPAA